MIEVVGYDLNSAPIHRITLQHEGLSAAILSYGAILQDLRVAGHARSLVLGYSDVRDYLTDQNYLGTTVGRVANRIKEGRALIDGVAYQLDQNLPDGHHLHGGSNGTGQRNWRVVDHSQSHVVMEDVLPDGHMGYPGTLTVQVHFSLLSAQTLSVEISAQSDAITLCNFAHHSYFNLGNAPTIVGHLLDVDADRYLVIDQTGIPTGETRKVAGTEFDFRNGSYLKAGARYDHNMCLAPQRRSLQRVAELSCSDGKTKMQIATTEAGLQIYTGHAITPPKTSTGHNNIRPFSGIALEPQSWPDAPNHPHFPSIVLPLGETYLQQTRFQFSHQD